MPDQDERLPEFVRVRDLEAMGLTHADAIRVMRYARPLIKIPGGRAYYARREAVETVLSECESWVA